MARRIFYSWQADLPTSVGRNFVRSILENVCKRISGDATLDEANRDVAVDSDTQGVAGQPPIAETIFAKIDESAVFVADMTFTGKRADGRPTPNPNVLIEYGWALKSLRYNRVVTLMNTYYGKPTADDLPFDLSHLRWPMQYHLSPDAESAAKGDEKRRFGEDLERAIRASLGAIPAAEVPPPVQFIEVAPKDGPARFRATGEAVGFNDHFVATNTEVFLASGPAMWLRLIPIVGPQKQLSAKELRRLGENGHLLMPLWDEAGSYSYVRGSDGVGMYRAAPTIDQRIETDSVTFAFRTGEIWSTDLAPLLVDDTRLYYSDIEKTLVKAIGRFRAFLINLGINEPYRWKAGLSGVKGRRLGYTPPPGITWLGYVGPICAADQVEESGTISADQTALEALLPFFERIFQECGIDRPDYLDSR
jgi:hypothetical protein